MISNSSKENRKTAYPKALLSILALAGGLAVFLIFASSLLISHPIGFTVSSYFYGGVDHTEKVDHFNKINEGPILEPSHINGKSNGSETPSGLVVETEPDTAPIVESPHVNGNGNGSETSSGLVLGRRPEHSTDASENAENFTTESPVLDLLNESNVQKSNITGASLADSGIISFCISVSFALIMYFRIYWRFCFLSGFCSSC